MQDDPSHNYLRFELADGGTEIKSVPVRDDDGLRQVWKTMAMEPAQVTGLSTLWQLAVGDRMFFAARFRHATLTHAMDRPDSPAVWDKTLAEFTGEAEPEDEDEPRSTWLPVLLSMSKAGGFRAMMPKREIIPGKLAFTLAQVALNPAGKIGMNHLLENQLAALNRSFDDLADEALENLGSSLTIHVLPDHPEHPGWGPVGEFSRAEGFSTGSAIALPTLYDFTAEKLNADRLVFGLSNPDGLMCAPVGSPWVADLTTRVRQNECDTDYMRPSLILAEPGGKLSLLEEFPGTYDK
jgi:hypothetical protein